MFGNFDKWLLFSPCPRFARKEELNIMLENRKISFKNPIYFNSNRYFLPLGEFIAELGGGISFNEGKLYMRINGEEIRVNFSEGNYKAILINNVIFFSLADICMFLKLKAKWNYKDNEIALYLIKDNIKVSEEIKQGKPALIRLEDMTAGPPYNTAQDLQKVRIMIDFLFAKGIPFHTAWIPRFVDPLNNIDNDISKKFNIENADFVFTLDYILQHNGIIGLHGYTHQYGDEVSADGTEFDENRNNQEKSIRNKLENAISIAQKLEIPFEFFESPHYASTEFQQSIMEQYFNYIYEPCVGIWGNKVVISPRNKRTRYIPTPLGFVSGIFGTEEMIYRINRLKGGIVASLFYHPSIEMKFINLNSAEDGDPFFGYSLKSPLHRIVDAFEKNNYRAIKIVDIPIV